MIQYILYVASEKQKQLSVEAISRLGATKKTEPGSQDTYYELAHKLLAETRLHIFFSSQGESVTGHLRQHPVDLLIYDERNQGTEVITAAKQIRDDVQKLAELWGPDFLFPMSRVVAILAEDKKNDARIFELGRLNLRDVCVAPASTLIVLNWLREVLTREVHANDKTGIALSGGGVEGFLYQLGVLYALERALGHKNSLRSGTKVISGVSSGSIAGSLFACKIPIDEVIRSIYRKSEKLPQLTSTSLFDLAGTDILKRILKESTSWAGLSPQKWIDKTLRAIPTGIFKGQALENYFQEVFAAYDIEDSFQAIKDCNLYVGATDQDSYQHVIFGPDRGPKAKITETLRASSALPPIFLPKQIDGRVYFDGQVTKTVSLEPLVEQGCRLILIINPLKPQASQIAGNASEQGGAFVITQTVKALISTRFSLTLNHITERYPDIDFIVFEPDEECAEIMSGSPMKYRIRTQLIQLSYRNTLRRLRDRHRVYFSKFAKYGFHLAPMDQLKKLEASEGSVFEELENS